MRDKLIRAMAEFYREVDGEIALANPLCRGCGECCHFERAEHILYASGLERLYLAEVSRPPARPDADPEMLAKGLRCPYQSGERCLAREGRTLGCRLHFCGWPDPLAAEDLAERWHRRLKRIHERFDVAWDYAPLLPIV